MARSEAYPPVLSRPLRAQLGRCCWTRPACTTSPSTSRADWRSGLAPIPTLQRRLADLSLLVSHIRPIFGEYYGDPYYSGGNDEDWELDHDASGWDADLVDGVIRWRAAA
jgi:hypothetical protein